MIDPYEKWLPSYYHERVEKAMPPYFTNPPPPPPPPHLYGKMIATKSLTLYV